MLIPQPFYLVNFLSNDDIEKLEKCLEQFTYATRIQQKHGEMPHSYSSWNYYSHSAPFADILDPKLASAFGTPVIVIGAMTINHLKPIPIHVDAHTKHKFDGIDQYSVLIPLEDINKGLTVVFNEEVTTFENSIASTDPVFCENHLTHLGRDYLCSHSLSTVYHWEKGGMFASSRLAPHCSGIYETPQDTKRAILLWVAVPRKYHD
jgi:hypothetical protein